MSAPAYKLNDRRGKNQPTYWNGGGNNNLYRAATQSQDREAIPNLSFDTGRNVSRLGHRQLANVGKFLFANFGPVHGAVLEQAELSVGHFIPQFVGKDKAWGEEAEAWLNDFHDNSFSVRGWLFDCKAYLKSLIVNLKVTGEHFTILTENPDTGAPLIQTIGAHRIGSGMECGVVEEGEYKGYAINKGIISNEYGAVLAYRVYPDGVYSGKEYVDISANDAFLLGFPEFGDEERFASPLASAACDWQDISERRKFELLAQKLGASIALIETNERGEPMPGIGSVVRPTAGTNTDNTATGLITEKYEGGVIRYMKAKSGESLQSLRLDRPSADSQAFEAEMIRGAFKGMEWDVDFSLDPSKVGGASMRVVIEKINTTIRKNQALAAKAMRRIDGWALSKAMKNGWISKNLTPFDWSRWEYQGPGEVTADKKYDSDVDIAEIGQWLGTRKDGCAKRGKFYEDVRKQCEVEANDQFESADRLAKKWGVSVETALTVLRPPTPNGLQTQNQQQEEKPTGKPTEG